MRPMGGFRCSPVSSVTTAARVVEHARSAAELGADVLVATAPFCTRTHGKEIAQHFRRLRAAVDLPLFAYDIPVQIAAALFGAYGTVLPRHTRPTPARNGATAVLDALAEAAAAVDPERPATALGIAAAGVVDPRTGVVTSATDSIRGWAGTALGTVLADHTGYPVACDNDVRATAGPELATQTADGSGHGSPWRGDDDHGASRDLERSPY